MDASPKIWNRTYILIFIINILVCIGQFMMNTLISKYTFYLGADAATAGIVTSMFSITALLLRPFSGTVIDAYPRNKVLSISIIIVVFAFLLYSCSHNIALVMAARLIHGAGMGLTVALCLVMAGDALPEDKLISGIGYFSLGQVVAQAVGPGVGLKLVELFGYHITFFMTAIIVGFALVLTFMIKSPVVESVSQAPKKFSLTVNQIIVKEALPYSIIIFFLSIAYCVINSFLLPYADGIGVNGISIFFTIQAGVLLFSRPLVSKLGERFGINRVLPPAMIIFAFSMYLLSISRTLSMFIITAFVSAFGYGACYPVIQALAIKSVDTKKRGAASSTNYIGVDLGYLIGAIAAGILIDAGGYRIMFLSMVVPIAISILCYFILSSRDRLRMNDKVKKQ